MSFFMRSTDAALADNAASVERMKKDIFFLASPECEGRGVDTKGINKAADHIANEFKKAGLQPGGINGYFQPFSFNDGFVVREASLVLSGPLGQKIELTLDHDYNVPSMSVTGEASAPLVFAGYGVTLPDGSYDDFKNLDVAGKIVVVLRGTPRWDNAHTIASGIRVPQAIGDFLILRAVRESGGFAIAVPDDAIAAAIDEVAREEGLLLCPEGGATYAALKQALADGRIRRDERAMLFNCATGLKYPLPPIHRPLDRLKPIDFAAL